VAKNKTKNAKSVQKLKNKKISKNRTSVKKFNTKNLLMVEAKITGLEEEEKVVIDLINHFYKKDRINPALMPIARDILLYRAEQLRESSPEFLEGKEYSETIFTANEAINSTTYFTDRNYTYLVSNTRASLISSEPLVMASISSSTMTTGLIIEVVAEVILIISSLLVHLPGGAKKAAEEAAETVATNPTVRNIIKELLELLRDWAQKTPREARESLRDILSRLASHLKDALSDFFAKVFASLRWWDILLMLADFILMFTPAGWLKKWGSLAAAILGLTGSIISKMA